MRLIYSRTGRRPPAKADADHRDLINIPVSITRDDLICFVLGTAGKLVSARKGLQKCTCEGVFAGFIDPAPEFISSHYSTYYTDSVM